MSNRASSDQLVAKIWKTEWMKSMYVLLSKRDFVNSSFNVFICESIASKTNVTSNAHPLLRNMFEGPGARMKLNLSVCKLELKPPVEGPNIEPNASLGREAMMQASKYQENELGAR